MATEKINNQSIDLTLNSTFINSFSEYFNNQYNVDRFYFVSNLESSNELDRSNNVASQASQSSASGGITCFVPMCYNNSKRNPSLSFYVIPKDQALRKKWLHMISRNFHRVCPAHFTGGRKTYEKQHFQTLFQNISNLNKLHPGLH